MIELDLDRETLDCLGIQLANDEWELFFGESNLEQAFAALAPTPQPAGPSPFLPAVPPQPREVVKRPAGEALPRKLYTGKETAAMLSTTEAQLREFVRHGELSYIDVGRGRLKPRRRFELDDIDKFLASRRSTEEWPKPPAAIKKRTGSPFLQYRLRLGGREFYVSTKTTSRRDAERNKRQYYEEALRKARAAE